MRRIWRRLCLLMMPVLIAGCASSGSMLTEDVGALRAGIGAAREQSRISFIAANKLAQEQAIERKIDLSEKTLREADFPVPVPSEDAAQWAEAFAILDTYSGALQKLVDSKRTQATGDAIGGIAASLNGPTINAKMPPTLSGAFATFGQALMQSRAEKSAVAVMRKTDPAFREVVGAMADAIGGSPQDVASIQFVVESNWTNSILPSLENKYTGLEVKSGERRRVAQDYVAAISARNAQLANLSQLHQSLIALGEAHSAAARGHPGDALFWIDRIHGWLDEIKRRAADAEKSGDKK